MRGFFEFGMLLVAASGVVGSPLRLGSGPVVQADGPMANMDANVFRQLGSRDTKSPSEKVRRTTQSKFNVMRRRLEMFTIPFPYGCSWPAEPLPRGSEDGEYEGLKQDHKAEEAESLELKKRARRFEHFPLNLKRRQPAEVTVTTTTTTQVTVGGNVAKTVTATATATETIEAAAGGGQGRNNGTEAVAAPAPGGGEASTTSQAGASATAGSSTSANSATPGAEAPANGQASLTNGASTTSSPLENAASSTPAEASSVASTSTTADGGVASTSPAGTGAGESQASSSNNGGASSTSSSMTSTTQPAQAGGISEFQNANGISVPLEILGENLPKPESNSMSGLPLTPDPNQPQPTTAGKDLPAPTLSPDRGTGGTLIQPEAGPGQGQTPPSENQTPADNQAPPDNQAGPDNQASSEPSQTAGRATPTDNQNAGASATPTQNQGAEPTPSATESTATDISANLAPTDPANNDNSLAEEQNSPSQGSRGNNGGQENDAGQAEAEGGTTVNQLRPDDIVNLLNSAPPKRLMTREELDNWLKVHNKIAARRRLEQRGGSGFQARQLRRRKTVL